MPPRWLIPTIVGVIVALLVAIGVVLVTGDDASAPVVSEASSSEPATIEPVASAAPMPTEVPTTEAPTSEVPVTEPVATETPPTESTTVPALPEESVPETTAASVNDSVVTTATDGFVRIAGDEFPIERTCVSNPLPGFSVTTHVFDDNGRPEVVELGIDEGNIFGLVFGEGYDVVDFGDDGFGMEVQEGDSVFSVSVNPSGAEPTNCPGEFTISSPRNPDFSMSHAVVDLCFGDVGRVDAAGEFVTETGYIGIVAEGTRFTARPTAEDSFAVDYTSVGGTGFTSDESTVSFDGPLGLQIRATLIGVAEGASAGQPRDVEIDIDESLVETCRPI